MRPYLIIVSRDEPGLYEYLRQDFSGDEKVEVLLDRRRAERRQQVGPYEPERRRAVRRVRPISVEDLRARGFVIVRREQGAGPRFGTSPLGGAAPTDGRFGEQYLAEYAPLFVGSPQMRAVKRIIEDVAATNVTVLIRGEAGVGKDLVARALHAASARHERPFVKVSCGALSTERLEAQLFGQEKEARRGAYRRKLGLFEFANMGTVFLEEVGALARPIQPKLLEALRELEFTRVGGREPIRVDVRVIASTTEDLAEAVHRGGFLEGLYRRLSGVQIQIPPLRERREEIPALAAALLAKFNQQYGRRVEFSPDTLQFLSTYDWPGNVREMENYIRQLVVPGYART